MGVLREGAVLNEEETLENIFAQKKKCKAAMVVGPTRCVGIQAMAVTLFIVDVSAPSLPPPPATHTQEAVSIHPIKDRGGWGWGG